MLNGNNVFDVGRVSDPAMAKKAEYMSKTMGGKADDIHIEQQEKPVKVRSSRKDVKKSGVARKRKVG